MKNYNTLRIILLPKIYEKIELKIKIYNIPYELYYY